MEKVTDHHESSHENFALSYVDSVIDAHFSAMKWSEQDVILEIGCGRGRTTKTVLLPKCPKFKKIVAIDINPTSIEYARKTYFDEKLEFMTQDILQRLDTEVGKYSYDKVVSFYALHHIPDFEKLFSVVSSVLKPGGYFLFISIVKNPAFSILRDLSTNEEWTKHIKKEDILAVIPPTENWKDAESEFKEFVSKFGLQVTKSQCDDLSTSVSDKQHFLDSLLTILPKATTKNLDPDAKNCLWNQAEQTVLKYCPRDEKGGMLFTYKVMQISGMKDI
ncbi:juvenile hormone acid O-methyltransferase-like [Centruroides vittatus]|uniref:juvenile hormone acid O-methyltransferase-like n=1 Tax=Centruroides vittatus TaxID=120091 RepID=UPI0035104E62